MDEFALTPPPVRTARARKAPKPPAPPKVPNPCVGAHAVVKTVPTEHWGLRLDFTPSATQLTRYCVAHGIKPVMNYRTESGIPAPTFDETAIEKLCAKHPNDPLFPRVGAFREVQKCKGNYVDGLTLLEADPSLGPDVALVRGEFLHVPKTGRLSMKGAPHQLQPKTNDPNNPYYQVRDMYISRPGHQLLARDFGGIEAVLTAYYSGVDDHGRPKPGRDDARQMLRLTNIDIHSFIACHAIGQPADLGWADDVLRAYFKSFKDDKTTLWPVAGGTAIFKTIRDACKTGLYGSLYGGGPGTLVRSQPSIFPTRAVAAFYQDLIFALFPCVRLWHWEVCTEADTYGYVTTNDGYRQWFFDVIEQRFSKVTKQWTPHLSPLANECIAAKPQHTAMLFTGAGLVRFWEERPDLREGLLLTIHDEIFGEWRDEQLDEVDEALRVAMEAPLPFLPLPEAWGLGSHLRVLTEAKSGPTWKQMRGRG